MATESIISIDKQKGWFDKIFDPTYDYKFKPVFKQDRLNLGFNPDDYGWTEQNRKDLDPFWDTNGDFRGRHLTEAEVNLWRARIDKSLAFLGSKFVEGFFGNPALTAIIGTLVAALTTAKLAFEIYAGAREHIIENQERYVELLQGLLDVYNYWGQEGSPGIAGAIEILDKNFSMIVDDLNRIIDLELEEAIILKDQLDKLVEIRQDVHEIKDNVDNLDWEDGPKVIDDILDIGKDVAGAIDRHIGTVELNENLKEKIKDVEELKQELENHFY